MTSKVKWLSDMKNAIYYLTSDVIVTSSGEGLALNWHTTLARYSTDMKNAIYDLTSDVIVTSSGRGLALN